MSLVWLSSHQTLRPKGSQGFRTSKVTKHEIVDLMHLSGDIFLHLFTSCRKLKDAAIRLEMSDSNLKKLCRYYSSFPSLPHFITGDMRSNIGQLDKLFPKIERSRHCNKLSKGCQTVKKRKGERPLHISFPPCLNTLLRIQHMIDQLLKDIQAIKQSYFPVEPSSASLPSSPSHQEEETFGEEINVCDYPEVSEELLLNALDAEIEEQEQRQEQEQEAKEIAASELPTAPDIEEEEVLMSPHFHETLKRKRRRNPSEIVQMNPTFPNCGNPYLVSTSNESNDSFISSRTSLPSTSFDSSLYPFTKRCSARPSSGIVRHIDPGTLEAKGLVKEDRDPNLYLPFSVNLPPLVRSPKLKKHRAVRLLEPDIGIFSKSAYSTYPNPDSPSSLVPSTSIHHIPSLLLSMNDHERRERLILLSFLRPSPEDCDPITSLAPGSPRDERK
jgi:hypothetical protein